jgi:hypothetical protein
MHRRASGLHHEGLSHLCRPLCIYVHVAHVNTYYQHMSGTWDPSQSRPYWHIAIRISYVCVTFVPSFVRRTPYTHVLHCDSLNRPRHDPADRGPSIPSLTRSVNVRSTCWDFTRTAVHNVITPMQPSVGTSPSRRGSCSYVHAPT